MSLRRYCMRLLLQLQQNQQKTTFRLSHHHHTHKALQRIHPAITATQNTLFIKINSQTSSMQNPYRAHQRSNFSSQSRLIEVGVLQTPKKQGKYEAGQLFLHQVFGYRGVILFPWVVKVYDRDDTKSLSYPSGRHGRDVVGKDQTYYQVLMDNRDCPYIAGQMPDSEGINSPIAGLDYVSHDDIVPYNSSEPEPIKHDLFSNFFSHDSASEPSLIAEDSLRTWQSNNHAWLEMSEVHRQTTNDIRITVTPFYWGIKETQRNQVYWWRYCIRLENLGKENVQLRERYWRIFSLSGTLETVRGRGVTGKEPILTPEEPAFQYSSTVSLQAPSGHMWGTFKMEREDGSSFECKIPPFSLESKSEE